MAEYPHQRDLADYHELRKLNREQSLPPKKPVKINAFEDHVFDIANELARLLLSKHDDYGPKNISQSPGGPINGLRVRMWDKIARINNLVDKKEKNPKHESLEDSFKDLANYAIIGLMVQRGQWPEE
jgi:hypothetical protein